MAERSPAAATPIAFVKAMLLAYEKYGQSPREALKLAQITPAQLRRSGSRITAGQLETFARTAMQQLDDEALGWFSRRLPWGSYGMLVRASLTAPTLEVALRRWCRHHRLLTEDISFRLEQQAGSARLVLEEHGDLGAMREFCLLTSLRNAHGVACWLVDSRIALREVRFPFAAPPHRPVYPLLFPGPVHFGAEPAGFSFDAQYLQLPVRRDERALQAMLQQALKLIVLPYRRDRLLVQRVRELLCARGHELRSGAALAAALHLSLRTLHRQLKDEGASLQALKDEARRERAVDLLRRTQHPLKRVAQAVGFGSEKSFARAFKQWTGVSPGVFRQREHEVAHRHGREAQ
ncbi:MAG: AraC family transcriptional regulator [Pseudomonadota bacterium]